MQAHIFYATSSSHNKVNLSKINNCNPTKMYCKHLLQYFELRAIFNNPASTFSTKQQANAEMRVAEKKMQWWERKPDFSHEVAVAFTVQLKKEFARK